MDAGLNQERSIINAVARFLRESGPGVPVGDEFGDDYDGLDGDDEFHDKDSEPYILYSVTLPDGTTIVKWNINSEIDHLPPIEYRINGNLVNEKTLNGIVLRNMDAMPGVKAEVVKSIQKLISRYESEKAGERSTGMDFWLLNQIFSLKQQLEQLLAGNRDPKAFPNLDFIKKQSSYNLLVSIEGLEWPGCFINPIDAVLDEHRGLSGPSDGMLTESDDEFGDYDGLDGDDEFDNPDEQLLPWGGAIILPGSIDIERWGNAPDNYQYYINGESIRPASLNKLISKHLDVIPGARGKSLRLPPGADLIGLLDGLWGGDVHDHY